MFLKQVPDEILRSCPFKVFYTRLLSLSHYPADVVERGYKSPGAAWVHYSEPTPERWTFRVWDTGRPLRVRSLTIGRGRVVELCFRNDHEQAIR